ncbi:hypothetical protein V7138_15030 [Bacillus sp. JJ1533]|uniref:hypothetical protein n=1 Tax=Bacillus sp. JJ1533 TaxID=3122959 RepID=UPI002FFE9BC2
MDDILARLNELNEGRSHEDGLVDHITAIVALLIEKGVFTKEEYYKTLVEAIEDQHK